MQQSSPLNVPWAGDGQTIGLLGGSFDPPHSGHVHITYTALRRLQLDWVWWLVSPGNPLKKKKPAPLARRIAACRAMIAHPRAQMRVRVTNIEACARTRYTADTLAHLRRRYPRFRFVWLMGADNLVEFHRWERWVTIAETTPIGVLARPGAQLRAAASQTACRYRDFRVDQRAAATLAFAQAPAWSLITGPMIDQSSTNLRVQGTG